LALSISMRVTLPSRPSEPRAATMIVVPALPKSTPGLRACQQRLVHVELLGQQLQRRAVAEGRQLGHGLVVVLGDVGRERAGDVLLGDHVVGQGRIGVGGQGVPGGGAQLAVHGQAVGLLEGADRQGQVVALLAVDDAGREVGAVQQHLGAGQVGLLGVGRRGGRVEGGGVHGLGHRRGRGRSRGGRGGDQGRRRLGRRRRCDRLGRGRLLLLRSRIGTGRRGRQAAEQQDDGTQG
jgi:hypothetical protein